MAEGETAIVLYKNANGIGEALQSTEASAGLEALLKYADLLRDVLIDLCGQREFQQLEFLESSESYKSDSGSSPLAIAVGTPSKDEEGQLVGLSSTKNALDVWGILTAQQPFPDEVADEVGLDMEGKLGFHNETEPTVKRAIKLNSQLDIESRFNNALSTEDEEAVAEALGTLLPASGDQDPVHPEDVLLILSFFLAKTTGALPTATGTGLLQRGRSLAGLVGRVPGRIFNSVASRANVVQHSLWRLEEFAITAGKLTFAVARKAVRPIIIGYILNRALGTIEASKTLENRLAKLPGPQAMDLYLREVLGDNYNEQMEEDMLEAIKDVENGLATDDYKDEKRLLTAAMLRRLEVEEWDKERMKYFYYGSYGLGPWYFDMEERLHNPYFIGARAWNGPIEGWIGKNKTYHWDSPIRANSFLTKIDLIERSLGKRLTYEQRRRMMQKESLRPVEIMYGDGGLLDGVLDRQVVDEHLAATAD